MGDFPLRIWARVCGGGISFPSQQSYTTLVAEDRELPRHVEYVRADAPVVADLVKALEAILPFVPKSSAADGGPSAGSAHVAAADKVRSALSRFRELEKGSAT